MPLSEDSWGILSIIPMPGGSIAAQPVGQGTVAVSQGAEAELNFMNMRDVLQPSAVLADLKAEDKKHLLADLADAASRLTGLRSREIHHVLLQRERLGTTGLGRGIAIPHGRLPDVRQITCLFARLDKPVAYDSLDGEPVDLVFLLLAPEHAGADHLKALAKISRLMRTPATVEMLRATKDRATLYAILTEPDAILSKAG